MRNRGVGFALVACLVLASCRNHVRPDTSSAPETPRRFPRLGIAESAGRPSLADVEIVFSRTRGMGSSPVYTLHLRGTGASTYDGLAFVKRRGVVSFELSRERLLELLDEFEALDFLQLDHACGWTVRDLAGESVSLRIGARSTTVVNLWREEMNRPDDDRAFHAALTRLGLAIDRLVEIEGWVGNDTPLTPMREAALQAIASGLRATVAPGSAKRRE